jgi:hypothetical protein
MKFVFSWINRLINTWNLFRSASSSFQSVSIPLMIETQKISKNLFEVILIKGFLKFSQFLTFVTIQIFSLNILDSIRRKLLPNTEKLFRYSVKMNWLYRKTFLFGYQYRITFSVIYADTGNRKRVYAWWRVPFKYNRKTFSVNALCIMQWTHVFIDAI